MTQPQLHWSFHISTIEVFPRMGAGFPRGCESFSMVAANGPITKMLN
jgi:hypothetical protein